MTVIPHLILPPSPDVATHVQLVLCEVMSGQHVIELIHWETDDFLLKYLSSFLTKFEQNSSIYLYREHDTSLASHPFIFGQFGGVC